MNRIRQLRKERGMTQSELSKILNVQGAAISKYESEKIPLTADTIKQLCDFFDVSSDYLLGNSDIPFPNEDLEWRYTVLSNRLGNILKRYRQKFSLSIESMCSKLKISKKTYEQLEEGTYTPPFKLIQEISEQTGYSIDFLTGAIDSDRIKTKDTFGDIPIFMSECTQVFQSRFEDFCLKNGITDDNVEKKLSLSPKEFLDIRYNRMPTLAELLKISYASNLSLDYLIGKSDNAFTNLSDDEVELILNYRDCKEAYKKNLLKRSSELSIASIDLDSKESVAADSGSNSTGKSLA